MLLRSADSSSEIIETGGYVASLTLGGKEVLLRSEDGRQTHGGACNLIPYAGRIRKGSYTFRSVNYEFPAGEDGNSIHGFARECEFRAVARAEDRVTMCSVLRNKGYPTELSVNITYAITHDSFSVSYTAINTGKAAAPLVIGSHPYFIVEGGWTVTPSADAGKLHLADKYFPDGRLEQFDFSGNLEKKNLDNCFVGGGTLRLRSEAGTVRIERCNMDYFLLYNGRYARGRSVAIEPMTGAPDAFNNGLGIAVIEQGKRFDCSYSITAEQQS